MERGSETGAWHVQGRIRDAMWLQRSEGRGNQSDPRGPTHGGRQERSREVAGTQVKWWRLGLGPAGEAPGDHGSLNDSRDLADRRACGLEVPEERRQGQSREALGFRTGATGRTEVVI